MTLTVEATYENGVFKLANPLPLSHLQKVKVTVQTEVSPLLAAYGIMGWKGSAEIADYFANDPDLDPLED